MKKLITPFLTVILISGFFLKGGFVFGQQTGNVSKETLVFEEFNYPLGQIPPGWVLDAEQAPPWSVNNSMMAGGQAPELYLGYSMAAGLSRLISAPVDVTGYTGLHLKYKQYLINYEMDFGEVIGLDVTFDDGESWSAVWERPLGTINIPQGEYEYYIEVPDGATEMKYAFRYDGNNYAINLWLIDDILIEQASNNDLVCAAVTGNTTPVKGKESVYSVEVVNGGLTTQSDYTVKLMMEGDVELASIPGTAINFNQKIVFEIPWTPSIEAGVSKIYGLVEYAQDEIVENNQSDELQLVVQTEHTASVAIGDGNVTLNFLPFNFFNLYSATQTIYYPEEIGTPNIPLKGLAYTYQFDQDVDDVQLKVLVGETTAQNLTDNWINPEGFSFVYDGMYDFKKGIGTMFIPFDEPYLYQGGNLIVYITKSYSSQVIGTVVFNTYLEGSARSRIAERDDAPWDPMVVPEYGYVNDCHPNIKILYEWDDTSIENQIVDNNSMLLYPNPTKDLLHINAPETIIDLKLINMSGQLVYQAAIDNTEAMLKLEGIVPGIYFVQITTVKGISTQKVMFSK